MSGFISGISTYGTSNETSRPGTGSDSTSRNTVHSRETLPYLARLTACKVASQFVAALSFLSALVTGLTAKIMNMCSVSMEILNNCATAGLTMLGLFGAAAITTVVFYSIHRAAE
jgi:hypothetical protein